MRFIIIHTSDFAIISMDQSKRPKGIMPAKSTDSLASYKNGLIVFSCIERNDDMKSVARGVREILKVRARILDSFSSTKYPIGCLVVIPFAHLSKRIPQDTSGSLKLLRYLHKSLVDTLPNDLVYLGDFGFMNSWKLEAYPHEYSTVYRET